MTEFANYLEEKAFHRWTNMNAKARASSVPIEPSWVSNRANRSNHAERVGPFYTFLKDVGPPPSIVSACRMKRPSLGYVRGNVVWIAPSGANAKAGDLYIVPAALAITDAAFRSMNKFVRERLEQGDKPEDIWEHEEMQDAHAVMWRFMDALIEDGYRSARLKVPAERRPLTEMLIRHGMTVGPDQRVSKDDAPVPLDPQAKRDKSYAKAVKKHKEDTATFDNVAKSVSPTLTLTVPRTDIWTRIKTQYPTMADLTADMTEVDGKENDRNKYPLLPQDLMQDVEVPDPRWLIVEDGKFKERVAPKYAVPPTPEEQDIWDTSVAALEMLKERASLLACFAGDMEVDKRILKQKIRQQLPMGANAETHVEGQPEWCAIPDREAGYWHDENWRVLSPELYGDEIWHVRGKYRALLGYERMATSKAGKAARERGEPDPKLERDMITLREKLAEQRHRCAESEEHLHYIMRAVWLLEERVKGYIRPYATSINNARHHLGLNVSSLVRD